VTQIVLNSSCKSDESHFGETANNALINCLSHLIWVMMWPVVTGHIITPDGSHTIHNKESTTIICFLEKLLIPPGMWLFRGLSWGEGFFRQLSPFLQSWSPALALARHRLASYVFITVIIVVLIVSLCANKSFTDFYVLLFLLGRTSRRSRCMLQNCHQISSSTGSDGCQ
jgi:hypothetical protein